MASWGKSRRSKGNPRFFSHVLGALKVMGESCGEAWAFVPSLKWGPVVGSVRDLSEDFSWWRRDPFR